MGQERNITRHKIVNWQDEREVQYWMRRLNITRSQVRTLAETMNKRVEAPSMPESTPDKQ